MDAWNVPVSVVSVNCDVPFTRVALQEDDRGILAPRDNLGVEQVVVVEAPEERGAIFACARLQRFVRGDKIRQVGSAGAPTHGEDAVDTTEITELVWASFTRACVRA